MGGQADAEKLINDVKVYDPATNTWQNLNDMPGHPQGRRRHVLQQPPTGTRPAAAWKTARGRNFSTTFIGSIANPWW